MVAIEPPPPLAQKIRQLQKEFAERYDSRAALKPPVHITVKPPFLLEENDVDVFREQLADFTARQPSFHVQLKGFGFFMRNRVVFLEPAPNPALFDLHAAFQRGFGGEERPYHPHITIGYRDLKPACFEKAVMEYQDRPFSAEFPVNALHFWKHEGGRWQTTGVLPFWSAGS